jgi:hypothetical protein
VDGGRNPRKSGDVRKLGAKIADASADLTVERDHS